MNKGYFACLEIVSPVYAFICTRTRPVQVRSEATEWDRQPVRNFRLDWTSLDRTVNQASQSDFCHLLISIQPLLRSEMLLRPISCTIN